MFSFHIFLSWPAPERSRTMCLWLSDLGEPENEGYTVCCDCMHSYCACMGFQVMDFFMVFFAIAVYFGVNTYTESWSNWVFFVPVIVLFVSLAVFPTGPLGLLPEKTRPLSIYLWRLRFIVLWSIAWMFAIIFTQVFPLLF